MMRPPRGCCAFMILIASCEHRNAPVRLTPSTVLHCSKVRSSIGTAGVPEPALLNRRSSLPKVSSAFANSARTASGLLTSVGTASILPPPEGASAAVFSNSAARRPASVTEYPAACSPRATARPMPLPAPVTSAIFVLFVMCNQNLRADHLFNGQNLRDHSFGQRSTTTFLSV